MTAYKSERPPQGWPALFANWSVGDSYPVVGHFAYVAECIENYGMDLGQFNLEVISDKLTRVTRLR